MNLNALFIGDKAENGQLYKDLLIDLVDEHLDGVKTTCRKTCQLSLLKNAHLKATKNCQPYERCIE